MLVAVYAQHAPAVLAQGIRACLTAITEAYSILTTDTILSSVDAYVYWNFLKCDDVIAVSFWMLSGSTFRAKPGLTEGTFAESSICIGG